MLILKEKHFFDFVYSLVFLHSYSSTQSSNLGTNCYMPNNLITANICYKEMAFFHVMKTQKTWNLFLSVCKYSFCQFEMLLCLCSEWTISVFYIRKAIHFIILNDKSKTLLKELALKEWSVFRVYQFRVYALTWSMYHVT